VQSLHQLTRTVNSFYFVVNSDPVFFCFFSQVLSRVVAGTFCTPGKIINAPIDLAPVLWLTLRMNTALYALLLVLAGLLFHAWVAYPLLLLATARRRRAGATLDMPPQDAPPLVVLLSAFNEADVIADRIANMLASDYPDGRLRVLIGTDGCTDDTAARATGAAAQAPWIQVIAFDVNRGKVAVLRDLVAEANRTRGHARNALLVFTDANTRFRPDALRLLVRHFADPAVGGVCGRLVFTGTGSDAEQSYWNLENALKACESGRDSCLGANGAIYALRPECFWQDLPVNTVVDDFVIGMKVREAGLRMIYDPSAVAEEDVPAIENEWCRRVRIGSGDYQAARLCRACLHPRFGFFAWCFWSHKILRWFTPHMLLIMIAAAVTVSLTAFRSPVIRVPLVLAAHAVCLGTALLLAAALAGRLSRRFEWKGPLWQLCRGVDHFVTMQAALLVGFLRYCRGNLSGAWTRTPRTAV